MFVIWTKGLKSKKQIKCKYFDDLGDSNRELQDWVDQPQWDRGGAEKETKDGASGARSSGRGNILLFLW